MEVSGQFNVQDALFPGKGPQYPLDRRLSWPQSWSGHSGKVKKSLFLPGIELWLSSPQPSHYPD